jgi:hypothetical protein
MMRLSLALIALCLSFLAPIMASAEPPRIDLREKAQRCATLLISVETSDAVACMHPRLVELIGGVDGALALLKRQRKEFAEQGVTLESVVTGMPGAPVTINNREFVLVPKTLRMRTPRGMLRVSGPFLAVREPGGESWTFLDIPKASPQRLSTIFPDTKGAEFEANLKLPPAEPPVLEER